LNSYTHMIDERSWQLASAESGSDLLVLLVRLRG